MYLIAYELYKTNMVLSHKKSVNSIYNAMKNAIINGISQKEEFDYKEYNQEIMKS